jgi:hypothetical protein
MPTDEKKTNYEVGYKKPPKRTQFKPGKSGNPKGRPKRPAKPSGQPEQPLFVRIAAEKVPVLIHGRKVRITKEECFYRAIFNDANKGDPSARMQVWRMLREVGKLKQVPQGGGVLVVPASPATSAEWEAICGAGKTETAPPLTLESQSDSSPAQNDIEEDWNNTPG